MVSTDSRSNRPLLRTVKVRDPPEGIGPPAPVNTARTPGTWGRADSSTRLSASSAIAATPWLAIAPTLQTSARLECTTSSGGDSGWEPGAPGPDGVRLVMVTVQLVLSPADAGGASATVASAAATARPSAHSRRMHASSGIGTDAASRLGKRSCLPPTPPLPGHDGSA